MRSMVGALGLALLCAAFAAGQERPANQPMLAITHVTVVDTTGGPEQRDMTVLVENGQISAAAPSRTLKLPRRAVVIPAKGKYLIPGLWDMHTHAFIRSRKSLPLYVMDLFLANGITGVRDMGTAGGPDDFGDYPYMEDLEWRQAIELGNIAGPRLNMALTIVNGPRVPGYPRDWAAVANAGEARQEVTLLKKQGADFIKVYDQLPRDAYFAIADEAKRQDLRFAGHVPILVTAAEASDAGQKSLEHDYGVLFGCSTREAEMMGKEEALYGAGKPVLRGILGLADVKALVGSYSESRAEALFAKFVTNDTYVTPTLVRAVVERPSVNDPRVNYFSPALREYTYPPNGRPASPDALEAETLMYQYHQRLAAAMQHAGVKLLAGTDSSFFGSALHDELGEMVKAGLTPMQALQTATLNPARYFGKLDSMGTIGPGKAADLVLLDADPLQNITNVGKISAVVARGRLFDRADLDHLLAVVESTNKPPAPR